MNFIKNLWNKVKNFFGGLFASKKVEKVELSNAVKAAEQKSTEVQANEVAQAEVNETEQAERANRLAELMNRVVELSKLRSYSWDEARAAYLMQDEATLARIERQMAARRYKAPSKSQLKQMNKAANTAAIAAA